MTTQALQKTEQEMPVVPADVAPADLQSALAGDLSRLTGEGRLKFYGALCQFTGLNPLSKPFDWLTLNGKLVLYANKGCAEQLRKIHRVSVEVVERRFENGCHIVRVKATDPTGRQDESIAAVACPTTATGDAMANALMKAETKAKRRVTLSICGLGMLDESEVETIRNAKPANVSELTNVDTASDRAAALNAEISQPVEAEIVTPAAVETATPQTAEPQTQQTSTAANLPPATPTTPKQEAAPVPQKATEATVQNAGPAAKTLPEDTVKKLEEICAARPELQKTCIDYLIGRGALQPGCGLETLKSEASNWVISNPARFYTAVERWAKSRKA